MGFNSGFKGLKKYSNSNFHENPTIGSRVVPYGRTDKTKIVVALSNFVKAPKNVAL